MDLRFELKRLVSLLVKTFSKRCSSSLVTIWFFLLHHVKKNLVVSEIMCVLDALLF